MDRELISKYSRKKAAYGQTHSFRNDAVACLGAQKCHTRGLIVRSKEVAPNAISTILRKCACNDYYSFHAAISSGNRETSGKKERTSGVHRVEQLAGFLPLLRSNLLACILLLKLSPH
ncbi:hypothetical protein X798_04300 [Onchocerca flexuosa]|uniref:SCP domain-containing protein n=2 Tax=Onchocerca flexuosa TaxID=387005 RepID=A0A183I485_9BILA|nr:hypothetical protein X798_04300 [Onchocerca flexuosa]VDP17550.1 unnamed protein product [Onchocerca flexuosa]